MNNPIRREALIHDLAIVLAGSLHPAAQIGPAPRLAACRVRDVLGITDGERAAVIESMITRALAPHFHGSGYGEPCWCPSPLTYAPQRRTEYGSEDGEDGTPLLTSLDSEDYNGPWDFTITDMTFPDEEQQR